MPHGENPFIGPRSFRTGEKLYGRDPEINQLLDLLIAERIVLLNSPSGAGKSSLLNAGLLPRLRAEGFVTPRALRVSVQLPDMALPPTANRFVVSLLLCLEEGVPAEARYPIDTLLSLPLEGYLDQRRAEQASEESVALLIDQFEEILTIDPNNREAKVAFFEELGRALRAKHRWALFAMREEFVAAMEPYARALPTRFATRYRLELLRPEQALDAIRIPAAEAGAPFAADAAEQLVRNLSLVRVQQADGSTAEQPGEAIEPVQLQVVLRRLWNTLPAEAQSIEADHVKEVGQVDRALADYYADLVAGAEASAGASERSIREWIARELITEQGFRNQVPQQPDRTRGLDNRALDALVNGYLVRADKRRGLIWYELAHDRLVSPIQANNAQWLEAHLHPLQRQAALWAAQSRAPGLLLRADALTGALAWAATHLDDLNPVEREFLDECRDAKAAEERERRAATRIKRLAVVASVTGVLALGLATFAALIVRSMFLMYTAVFGVVSAEFGWNNASFNANDWQAALHANTEMARSMGRTNTTQLSQTAVVLGPSGDAYDRRQLASVLEKTGFGSVTQEAPELLAANHEPSLISRGVERVYALLTLNINATGTPPLLVVNYHPTVDPDVVRVVVYQLNRARFEVAEISMSPGTAARTIRVVPASAPGAPLTDAEVAARLGDATPAPVFVKLRDVQPELDTAVGVAKGEASEVRMSYQEFSAGRMIWIDLKRDLHYVLAAPAMPGQPGKWQAYSNADKPSVEEVESYLNSGAKGAKLFQDNGGFLQIWLKHRLHPTVGPPIGDTLIDARAVFQEFAGGAMLAPLPDFDTQSLRYSTGTGFGVVNVLVLLNDGTYRVNSVPYDWPPK